MALTFMFIPYNNGFEMLLAAHVWTFLAFLAAYKN